MATEPGDVSGALRDARAWLGAREGEVIALTSALIAAPTPNLAELEIHITTLNPGEEPHPPHQHPEEELMIIKEGTLAAQQGQTTNLVTAGGIIFEAANELHGLRNIGTNPATYYVIKIVPHDLAH